MLLQLSFKVLNTYFIFFQCSISQIIRTSKDFTSITSLSKCSESGKFYMFKILRQLAEDHVECTDMHVVTTRGHGRPNCAIGNRP
jgi:hypothetical protein